MSDLLKSKNASFTFWLNSALISGAGAGGGGGGGGAETVTTTLAFAVPPGPFAVIVYVAESVGLTFVEPSGATFPTPGSRSRSVAFVDDQFSVVLSPLLIVVCEAFNVTVGFSGAGAGAGGGGGGGVTFFLQAPANARTVNALRNTRILRIELLCIEHPPSHPALREHSSTGSRYVI